MADKGQRFYWLKLHDDFFGSRRIKKLRKMAGGDTYLIIYLKMQLVAMKNKGIIEFTNVEDDFIDEIALEIEENPEDIKMTLSYLLAKGLAETSDTEFLHKVFFPYAVKNVGSEGSSAQRMRDSRAAAELSNAPETPKLPQCANTDAQSCTMCAQSDGEIEKEIDIRDRDKEIEKESYISTRSMQPSENANELTDAERAKANRLYSLYKQTMSETQAKRRAFDDIMKDRDWARFWAAYPRHENEARAQAAFFRCTEPTDKLIEALTKQKQSDAWNRENGRYIPQAERWLKEEKWKDELTCSSTQRDIPVEELPDIANPKK